jgi:hypothetical protein
MCYHFAAETFAERSKWVKLLDSVLRSAGLGAAIAPQSPHTLLRRDVESNRLSNSVVSPERLMLKDALASPDHRLPLAGGAEGVGDRDGGEPEAQGPTLSQTMQIKSKEMEELFTMKNEFCVERELNRRLERKIRILEKGVVETRNESEGLRSALMAAQDRIAMFTSNSVPCAGIVSQVAYFATATPSCSFLRNVFDLEPESSLAQSASNWLHVESDKQTLDDNVNALTQQADDLDRLLRSVQQSVSGEVHLSTWPGGGGAVELVVPRLFDQRVEERVLAQLGAGVGLDKRPAASQHLRRRPSNIAEGPTQWGHAAI